MLPRDGGYDEGYRSIPCFWGTEPSSLVKKFLTLKPKGAGARVLDLGCGEGKNAAAFSRAGYLVDAIDCSSTALSNGLKAFVDLPINWRQADAVGIPLAEHLFDVVVAYGLFHCLNNEFEVARLIEKSQNATKIGGYHIICVFNDRSHDMATAHPDFRPLLLKHEWYIHQYSDWRIINASDSDLWETHPHNNVEHRHSLTRMLVRRLA